MPISIASDADRSARLVDQIRDASGRGATLRILGGDTKAFYGRAVEGEPLRTGDHRGVMAYEPSELVITARAGTPIVEIEALLAEHGQMLAFEPPILGEASTLGGVVAAGLAGPRRPFTGAVRDYVLGVTVLDGRGQSLRFGGTVFKNVAGFDAFRLMAGALGCLGVLLDISLRVVPKPKTETHLSFREDWGASHARLRALTARQSALSGATHDGEQLHLRFSGPGAYSGGEAADPALWRAVRNLETPLLSRPGLWRLAVPASREAPDLPGERLIDWAGGQVWLSTDADGATVRAATAALGGHATRFRRVDGQREVFSPLPAPLLALHKRLKAAFDPARVFNSGRMYEGL